MSDSTRRATRRARLAAALLSCTLLAGCGSDNEDLVGVGDLRITCAAGSVSGAGSTFVQMLAQQWSKDYQGECAKATVDYKGVGSGAGIQQLTSGTVDFA